MKMLLFLIVLVAVSAHRDGSGRGCNKNANPPGESSAIASRIKNSTDNAVVNNDGSEKQPDDDSPIDRRVEIIDVRRS